LDRTGAPLAEGRNPEPALGRKGCIKGAERRDGKVELVEVVDSVLE